MSDTSETESPAVTTEDRPGRLYRWLLSGLTLVLLSFPLLFWNESQALHQYRRSGEGVPHVHSARMDRIDPEMNGKLVHVSGLAITGETLRDPVFGVAANALKLRRRIQVYQWHEVPVRSEGADGDGEEPSRVRYTKGWSDRMIPSSTFQMPAGHRNPSAPPYPAREFVARTVTLGAYTLSRPFIDRIDRFQPMKIDGHILSRLPVDIRWDAHEEPHGIYIGDDPGAPAVGDVRVSFQVAPPATISVVARQAGNQLLPYRTDSGMIALLRAGAHTADGMLPSGRQRSALLTWGLRLGGFGLMFFGLALMLLPILRQEGNVPFLRSVGAKADPWLLAFLMAAALTFATIAAVWFVARPVLAAVLVGASVAFFIGFRMLPDRHPT